MKRATVVIGANYGDEGKGLIVDYLASKTPNAVVVRFNGGAQAGHTVVTPDGERHVFHHLGAGTFAGAHTYLAKHFVLNPLLFWKEINELSLGVTARIRVGADPRCFVSTPYDMMINQRLEDKRGAERHGSVGVGFGETIERNQYPAFRLYKDDLKDVGKVRNKLKLIRDVWIPQRCHKLGIDVVEDAALRDELLDEIVKSFTAFNKAVYTAGAEFLDGRNVIFEGAQGLALDMDGPNFPHVTRSNTGLTNVVPLAAACNLGLDVIYVTRPYLTKHGAGPLPGECEPWASIKDDTNLPHPFQGVMRYAKLDVTGMLMRIRNDIKLLPGGNRHCIAMTCMDHMDVPNGYGDILTTRFGKDVRYKSDGPTREHVKEERI